MNLRLETSSFRDRDGFIFYKDQVTYRAIRYSYKDNFEKLISSDLYKELTSEQKLIAFEEEQDLSLLSDPIGIYKIIRVKTLPFISYPSEWNFSQLKKAALLTLEIQKKALTQNLSLKDATAYNIQFIGNKAIFIDSLSFEAYVENQPWHAYKQFCQHFLGPLLLAHYGMEELQTLFVQHLDGIPLQLCSKLLPFRSKFNLLAYTHIHLHAQFETKHASDEEIKKNSLNISKKRVLALLEHLEQGIKALKTKSEISNWTGYYEDFSYSNTAYSFKKEFVEDQCKLLKGKLCIDLGANTGEFSFLAANYFEQVIACDNDAEVLKRIQKKKVKNILPLIIELSNPTPAYGWNGQERKSFLDRIRHNDLTLALALMHHLCIGNNIPLHDLANFFAEISKHLIIEFVPKSDIQVNKLLVTKKDIFEDYTLEHFKEAFSQHFTFKAEAKVPDSDRILFLLQLK